MKYVHRLPKMSTFIHLLERQMLLYKMLIQSMRATFMQSEKIHTKNRIIQLKEVQLFHLFYLLWREAERPCMASQER